MPIYLKSVCVCVCAYFPSSQLLWGKVVGTGGSASRFNWYQNSPSSSDWKITLTHTHARMHKHTHTHAHTCTHTHPHIHTTPYNTITNTYTLFK